MVIAKKPNKKKSKFTQTIHAQVFGDGHQWTVHYGELKRHQGNPGKTDHLFKVILFPKARFRVWAELLLLAR